MAYDNERRKLLVQRLAVCPTASSQNGQPWTFIVIQDHDMLRQLGALARTGRYIAQAPLAVVVCITPGRFSISDASRAIQSMMLAAWSRGVGCNWVGFHNLEDIKQSMGIPEQVDLLAIVPFGCSVNEIGSGQKQRKPLGEVVFRERFGQPFT